MEAGDELNAFHNIPGFFECNGKLNWSGSTNKEQVNYSLPSQYIQYAMRDEEKYLVWKAIQAVWLCGTGLRCYSPIQGRGYYYTLRVQKFIVKT